MTATLAEALKPASISFDTLHQEYNPLLALVRELIGIVPNCDPLLEIWKPGFRTYNLLVPAMFNLPNTLFGATSFKAAVGLAMYASSKAACAYCTAHACSFALRRGVRADAITGNRTPKEEAVVALAEGLAHIPACLTVDELRAVKRYFTADETEGLVYAISMMGFLNKFMNAAGVELEQGAINDVALVLAQTDWNPGLHAGKGYRTTKTTTPAKDNLATYLRVIRHAPGAVRWEKQWTKGVPDDYRNVSNYLGQHTGYTFPILKPLQQGKVLRTLARVLRDNLDEGLTATGLKVKMMAGYSFAIGLANQLLQAEIKGLSEKIAPQLNPAMLDRMEEVARLAVPTDKQACQALITSFQQQFSLTGKEAAALLLALAASQHPAQLHEAVQDVVVSQLAPDGVVEMLVWLSVLQLLHRLSSYYRVVHGDAAMQH